MTKLTHDQKMSLLRAYDKRHRAFVHNQDAMKDLGNLLDIMEDYLHICKRLGISVESEILRARKNWEDMIDKKTAPNYEHALRQLVKLWENEDD